MKKFKVNWSEQNVSKILSQVERYEIPKTSFAHGWTFGCEGEFLERFQKYWLNDYDYKSTVDVLNKYPQFVSNIGEYEIHYVYIVGESNGSNPLLLLHGWPSSHYEFWGVIDQLAFPSKYGKDKKLAFDLIIPSLPGFGFSSKPNKAIGARETAKIFNLLTTKILGHPKYMIYGSDWGVTVAQWAALEFSNNISSIHISDILASIHTANIFMPFGENVYEHGEREWNKKLYLKEMEYGGYNLTQSRKPDSLALLSSGNPMGQASWILERFHDWADLSNQNFESLFSFNELLTTIMIYITSDSFNSSLRFYYGSQKEDRAFKGSRYISVATGFTNWKDPRTIPVPKRMLLKNNNIIYFCNQSRGGHFPAHEAPAAFVNNIHAWLLKVLGANE